MYNDGHLRKTELLHEPEILFLVIHSREMKKYTTQNLYINIYRSIIHNRQSLETIQMSIN